MSPADQNPWDLMPPLRADRLDRLRRIAWQVQERVASSIDWAHGENLWVAGCKAYRQRVTAFSLAAKAEYADWLSVEMVRGQFVLKVGGVPIRMYRPPSEGEVPEKYTHATPEEAALLNHALTLFDLPPSGRLWRLEVHSTRRARPTDVVLVQVDEDGNRFNAYSIPGPIEVIVSADVVPSNNDLNPRKPAVVLPDAEVSVRRQRDDARPDDIAANGTSA